MSPRPTIGETLARARRRLALASFGPPTREASLLLAHALDLSEAQVLAHHDKPLTADALERFRALLERRLAGEPVAYIRGFKEFFGRDFAVDRRVLIPRPETEHLVEAALDLDLPSRVRAADLGTGSGCIAITLALEAPGWQLIATDISLEALSVAAKNRRRYGVDHRVALVQTDLARGLDLGELDLVVSNPPYVGTSQERILSPEILEWEPKVALFAGDDGGDLHRRLLGHLVAMSPGAWLLVEIGADQSELLSRASADSPFELVAIRNDYAGRPRIAQLRRG